MLKLYGLELSFPVNRVRFCLNAMGIDYEYIRINPIAGETQTEDFLKLSPAGKIPAIDDDGFGLSESNTIMKYIARKHNSDFYPTDIVAQANVDMWLDFIAIHVGNGFGIRFALAFERCKHLRPVAAMLFDTLIHRDAVLEPGVHALTMKRNDRVRSIAYQYGVAVVVPGKAAYCAQHTCRIAQKVPAKIG